MIPQQYKELLKISVPATLSSLFIVIIVMIDTQMVSPLGTTAIAAMTIASGPELFIFLVFSALGTATTIVVSQAHGRKSRKSANAVLLFSLAIALGGSVVLGLAVGLGARPILFAYGGQADTLDMSVTALRILLVGLVFQSLMTVASAALRGVGDAQATMWSSLVMGVVDIALNYLLIEGHLGFPALGVAGAALATTLGFVAGFVVSLFFLLRGEGFLSLRYCVRNDMRIAREDARAILGNLANVFGENILTRLGFLVSGMVVARLGSYETSVYSVGSQLLSLSFAFGDGIQAAMLALVGKSFGEKDRGASERWLHVGIRLGLVSAAFVAVLCIAFAGPFFSLFSDQAEFCAAGGVIGVFVAIISPFQINRIVRVSVMRAFGDSKTPRRIATVSALVLDPPLSLLFAIVLGMGQWGLWLGTLLSQVAWFAFAQVTSRREFRDFDKLAASADAPEETNKAPSC